MLIRLIGAVLTDLDRLAHMVRDLSLPRGLVAHFSVVLSSRKSRESSRRRRLPREVLSLACFLLRKLLDEIRRLLHDLLLAVEWIQLGMIWAVAARLISAAANSKRIGEL